MAARIAIAIVNFSTKAGYQVRRAVYTRGVSYSEWMGTMLPWVVMTTTILGTVSCASSASKPLSRPAFVTAADSTSSDSEQGPVDLRIALDSRVLGQTLDSVETSDAELEHNVASLANAVDSYQEQLADCLGDGTFEPGKVLGAQTVTLSLEVDADGTVLGGSTEPAPGLAGASKVAGCVLGQARGWLFPARERRGRTILIVPLVIAN